jgi:glycosyltransferase involved in cell wall biosynthesis
VFPASRHFAGYEDCMTSSFGVDYYENRTRPVLICFSHLRWNFVYQRPQHLLSRAARTFSVYFFEEPLFERGISPHLGRHVSAEGVQVVTPLLPEEMNAPQVVRAQRKLVDGLVRGLAARPTLWYYTPMALPFSRHLAADLVVYDNMDELSAFRGAPPRLVALERELFRRADVVYTGGLSLYEAKRSRHHNVHAFPSSIDAAHFGKARRTKLSLADQEEIAHPRLGFFGVIDERLDLDLVAKIADLRPDWQLIMIGPVVKIDPASLPRRPNIHWLGARKYQDLPAYLSGWDAGIMPFALNASTRFISPTKTPEFLAAGLPVVCTPIRDVVRPYGEKGLVEIARDAEDFVARAERLLGGPGEDWLRRVDQHLASSSWDLTWAAMLAQMAKARAQRASTAATANDREASYV